MKYKTPTFAFRKDKKKITMKNKKEVKVNIPEKEYRRGRRDRKRLVHIKKLQKKQNKVLEQIK